MHHRTPLFARVIGLIAVAASTQAIAAVRPIAGEQLHSLQPPVLLPDGHEFKTWEVPLTFSRTYYVDQANPAVSDDNPGTQAKPFKTIGQAAKVLQPGERVVVAAGVYREHVKPARGGTAPDRMISYEAAPGAKVIIKGSRVFEEKWQPSHKDGAPASDKLWSAPLPARYFDDNYNPFDTDNVTAQQFEYMKSWAWDLRGKQPYTLPRGLIFQDGQPLAQAGRYEDLPSRPGSYWVDRPAQVIHIHPAGDVAPEGHLFEITTQRIAFGPEQIGLGYIRVKGFAIEQVGNAFPMQQEGAISTWRGHRWIIEDNTIRWANGVGIDVGCQYGGLPQPPLIGQHIVRHNTITDIGVCGIAGLGRGDDFGLLIEGNTIRRAAYHDVERLYETAGIKTHLNTNCLIRGNLIADTLHGPGIWLDFTNANSRGCQNIVLDTHTAFHGGIFVEASFKPNLIDHNFIWNTQGNGIYEHDSSNQIFVHNFIGQGSGPAIKLNGKVTDRLLRGQPIVAGKHLVQGNIFFANRTNGVSENPRNQQSTIADNIAEGITATFNPQTNELTWSFAGAPPACPRLNTITYDFFDHPRSGPTTSAGPFGTVPTTPTTIRLSPR